MISVFVNGRRIAADIVDLNLEEGWVAIEDTSILEKAIVKSAEAEFIEKPIETLVASPRIQLPIKKLFGKVTVAVTPDLEE